MELNLISFIGIIIFFSRSLVKSIAIKYFSFQVNVSVILFFLILIKRLSTIRTLMLIVAILIAKVGIAPFHLWFVSIISKVDWSVFLWMAIPQKLIPLLIMSVSILNTVPVLFLLISVAVSLAHRVIQLKIKKVVAISSVFSLNWIALSIITSYKEWTIFFTIYRILSLSFIVGFVKRVKSRSARQQLSKSTTWILVAGSLFLAGVPPSPLFFIKIRILADLIKEGLTYLSLTIIVSSLIILYIYVNLALNILVFSARSMRANFQPSTTNISTMVWLTLPATLYSILNL